MTCAHASSLHTLAPLALALLAGGCTAPYQFTVDAFGVAESASPLPTSYELVDARPRGSDPAASGMRIRDVLRTALSARGLFEAPDGVAPDLTIEFDAGISSPVLVEHTYAKPEYVVHQVQVPAGFGGCGGGYVVETRPELQPAQLVTEHGLEYRKHLDLVARVARDETPDGPRRELWRVHVENQDGSRDLGRYVTLMAAAALDLIGRDAQTRRTVTLTDRDGRVLFIEVGMR